jgi:hypothetical protein
MLSMWYINISKGIPSTVFSKLKSLNISALEEDRKTMAFDKKGWLLPLANVRPEINCLRSFTTRSNYDTVGRKKWVPYSTKFVELKWQHSRLNYILWLTILPYMNTLLALKRLLNYLAFKSFHYEFTWWRLFQKRVVCTKLDTVQPILCDLPREQWNMVT